MEFAGEFETHVTVHLDKSDRIEELQKWATQHGLKCLHIVLARGDTPSQPMLTRHGRGNLTGELEVASELSESLIDAGFPVTRIKVEAAPWNQDAPQSFFEAFTHSLDRYFEHHIKLRLDPNADLERLTQIAQRHEAHLSRNALRNQSDGHQERFVTQRCHMVGRDEARQRLANLMADITTLKHPVIEVEEEFVVYDSNFELDAGWIWNDEPRHMTPESNQLLNEDDDSNVSDDYPKTYQPQTSNDGQVTRPKIFDPALKQFSRAFRCGEPKFHSSAIGDEWQRTRQQVISHLLTLIDGSGWKENLVLRGSLLLKAWLGDTARQPGDIDWVFRSREVSVNSMEALELFDTLVRMVTAHPYVGKAVIEVDKIAVDEIWTYERAAGRRIVFPWRKVGLPPGTAQIDVVFGEELFVDPIQVRVPLTQSESVLVWAVTKELSLAWKLLWLETDSYPQGKDLYDATLLAELAHLPLDLLLRVLHSGDWRPTHDLSSYFPLKWRVDWETFKLEYPWVEGTETDWKMRISKALAPTFASSKRRSILPWRK